jgi:hypothetical protein
MVDSLRDHATRIPRFFGQAAGTTRAIEGTGIVQALIFRTNRRDHGVKPGNTTIG